MPFDFRHGERTRSRLSSSYRSAFDHERYSSMFAATTVKILLLAFLLAFLGLMTRFLQTDLRNAGYAYRFFFPALAIMVVLFLVMDIRKSIKGIRDLRREMRERGK
jgi:hypothetical protein